ncbi:hypothetical protein BOSE127_170344 [Bosea sp. 127]|nr:hypothetical protein BOSE127_170344 [Bosea sp. 127]
MADLEVCQRDKVGHAKLLKTKALADLSNLSDLFEGSARMRGVCVSGSATGA